jgi:hypothetical protein
MDGTQGTVMWRPEIEKARCKRAFVVTNSLSGGPTPEREALGRKEVSTMYHLAATAAVVRGVNKPQRPEMT